MKKIILSLATIGLVLASCSKDEVTGVNVQGPDVIKFNSTTSRAAISNIETIKPGFRVYGTSGSAPAAWYTGIDGTVLYRYSGGAWGWASGAPQWPTETTGYPMTFYAMYPADDTNLTATAPSTLTREITIAATRAAQTDMLGAKASTTSKPSDGALSMTFNHILSKVDFGVIAGLNTTPVVLSMGTNNVYDKATYDYVGETWLAAPAISGNATYAYYDGAIKIFTIGTDTAEETAQPFYIGTNSEYLMLMPQTHAAWQKNTATLATGSYAGMIYRLGTITDANSIGYVNANNYLIDYPGYDNKTGWGMAPNNYTNIGSGAGQYSGQLFIKVGFPLGATDFTWEPQKGYTYNICLGTAGSTNGYYVENTYYDEHGQDTGIPVIGPDETQVKPGDPVSDGTINFKIVVAPWVDQPATPLQ